MSICKAEIKAFGIPVSSSCVDVEVEVVFSSTLNTSKEVKYKNQYGIKFKQSFSIKF